MCETASKKSTTTLPVLPIEAAATPKNKANITIGSISFFAITATMLSGIMCSIKFLVSNPFASMPTSAVTGGNSSVIVLPGSKIFTKNNPSSNATIAAVVKYKSVFTPIRPTDLKSPTLATPTTNTENTSGAMIILIRRIKISLSIRKLGAKSFQK